MRRAERALDAAAAAAKVSMVLALKMVVLPTVLTQRLFLKFSELQVRVDGVNATSRHRDAVDEAVRESTRLVRQFRECRSTQVLGAGLEIAIKPDLAQVRALGGGAAGAALARWVLGITFMLVVTV